MNIGAPEIVVLGAFCFGVFIVIALAVLAIVLIGMKRGESGKSTPQPALAPLPPQTDSAVVSAEVVAGITRRFCPQCRSPLASDAPEGLCPACLMAGALGSSAQRNATEGVPYGVDGTAVTTPPSGSQPPIEGAPPSDLAAHFPQLEILELLGRGGMGSVYKARQKNLDRIVALKVIPPEAAADPAFAERFAREARALARLNHANIVTVHDFGQAGEVYFLVMEYVDGVNLRQALRAGKLEPREALAIVPQICDALQYAHDQGVVHRDIKPENVLLDRAGRVKIADFGLAKLLTAGRDDFTLTRTQQIMGTPRYMAPEQMERPSAVDHRADIYSLGVVIYEMLTGEIPMGKFAMPSEKVQVDVRIDQVVLRALEREPERRYQRASQVKSELASASRSQAPLGNASPPSSASPMGREAELPGVHSQAELGSEGISPTWHTPAPATKQDSSVSQPPGGVPLGMVLAVALGMVLGVIMMTGGLFALIFAFHEMFSKQLPMTGPFWGWVGAGLGCLLGGFGLWAESYKSYRQLSGAEDLMRTRQTTWFDWAMRGYLLVGIVLIVAGCWDFPDGNPDFITVWQMVLLGVIAIVQSGLFLLYRTLMAVPARPSAPIDPRRESLRRRVAGPAIGLMIVGLLGLTPSLLMIVVTPAFVLVPGEQTRPKATTVAPAAGVHQTSAIAPLILAQPSYSEPAPTATAGASWAMLLMGAFVLASTIPSILLIIAGWRMRQLKSYGLATVASVMALLPCTAGWLLGLPIGIWSLAVLLQPELRDGFES